MYISNKSLVSSIILTACLAGCPANQAQVPGPTLDYNVITLAGKAGNSGSADETGSLARFNNPAGVAVDSAGNVYVADIWNHTIRKIGPGSVVTTLAGTAGFQGSADQPGSLARFNNPSGVAVDSAGNVFVADHSNHAIRKIWPNGVVTTLAGLAGSSGSADGTGSAARFNYPYGVAVDSAGTVYVADYSNHTIRKIGSGGVVTTLAGLAGVRGSTDGTGTAARFRLPSGVAVDSAGNLYVADRDSCTIRKIGPVGEVTTLAGLAGSSGSADGTGSAARFNYPYSVAVDSAFNVYVADSYNNTIRKIGAGGVVTTLAGLAGIIGSIDGIGSAVRFNYPYGVAVDNAGKLYVADKGNHTIRMLFQVCLDVPGIDLAAGPVGAVRQLDTSPQTAITWQWQILQRPSGSTTALSSLIIRNPMFIPDVAGYYVFQLSATNAAGMFGIGTVDFWACEAPVITLAPPSQTAAQGDVIRLQVTALGLLLRYQWLKEGLPLPGQTNATLSLSNIQNSAAGNYTVMVNNPVGSLTSPAVLLTVLAPSKVALVPWSAAPFERTEGDTMEFMAAASVTGPWHYQWSKNDIDLPVATNALLSLSPLRESDSGQYGVKVWNETECGNATINLLVKLEYNVRTLAGKAGISGSVNGTGGSARFYNPSGLAVDSAGKVYVADRDNHTIRQIGPGGVVTTLAGKAGSWGSADGKGSAAQFSFHLEGVAVDSAGKVYVADRDNHTIRQIEPGGVVTTLAGKAGSWGSADGTGIAARFNYPYGVAVDSASSVYVADTSNHTIRKIGPGGMVTTLAGKAGSSGITDGPGSIARFCYPASVAVDSAGNVYVADYYNKTIRKIVPGGVVTTLAGKAGSPGSIDGTGSEARFDDPRGVAVDSAGSIYVADTFNSTIRVLAKLSPDRPTIDSLAGPLGVARQLNTMPQQAVRCAWQILQRPAGSTTELSSLSLRNPTFTPDKPGRYVFQLTTTDPSGAMTTRTREFTAFDLGPIPPFSLRALRSGPTVILVWTAAQDYLLESAESLGSNAVWSPVPGVTTNTITLPLGVTNQYFRLRK